MKKRDFVDPEMEEAIEKMMEDPDFIEKITSDEAFDDDLRSSGK